MKQTTLVKVIHYISFENDVSDLVVENFTDNVTPEIYIEGANGELITGEVVESFIENIVIMNESEADDEELFRKLNKKSNN